MKESKSRCLVIRSSCSPFRICKIWHKSEKITADFFAPWIFTVGVEGCIDWKKKEQIILLANSVSGFASLIVLTAQWTLTYKVKTAVTWRWRGPSEVDHTGCGFDTASRTHRRWVRSPSKGWSAPAPRGFHTHSTWDAPRTATWPWCRTWANRQARGRKQKKEMRGWREEARMWKEKKKGQLSS